jgi:iron complex outermembrane receptor protein
MQKTFILLAAILGLFPRIVSALPTDNNISAHLKGKVIEKSSGEALPGASIYFPDLKTGTITQADGTYSIDKLPASKILVQVSLIGYQLVAQTIDLTKTATCDFTLEETATEIGEVVVTGQSGGIQQNRTPSPVAIVPHNQLLQNAGTNIIDAIASEPGVSQVTTGAGISKPVIRGLGYNRVVVIHDGVRQEGQQWGDEHGIEIDEFGVDRVEILKGPASLAYGSDAMAGVVNMISAPTVPDGVIRGNIVSNYQTNNGLIGYSGDLSGNKNGLIWDSRYSGKLAHAYENKYDGPVFNSGFRENAASATIGFNRSWGYSHLHLSLYHLKPGMVEGERDSLTGKFVKPVILPNGEKGTAIATSSDFNSYQPRAPFQKILHYKAVWDNSFFIGQCNVQTTIGFQQNQRKEYEDPDAYGLYFLLNTLNYDLRYNLPSANNWKISFGTNGMSQQSKNKGSEFLVPAYRLFDFGLYGIVSKQLDKVDLSGGLRYDQRVEKGDALYLDETEKVTSAADPNAIQRFSAFDQTFRGISGSLGATWQVSGATYTKVNVSRGFRAPNIAELGSNGVHEGTLRYEIGNPELKPETSLQFDWAIGMNTHHVSAELDLFHNTVDHFIFAHKLNSVAGGDSLREEVPVFKFSSGKAHLYGGELRIDIHPHPFDWLHFENTFSYVHATLANQPDSSRWLPLTPAPRWISGIRADIARINRFIGNGYIKLGIDHNWSQEHVYAAYGTETRTPGYTLFDLGAGADVVSEHKTLCSVYISVNNLTNTTYQNHLSRLKYGETNYATGRTGVYNMGRNVSFKLIIPVDFTESHN